MPGDGIDDCARHQRRAGIVQVQTMGASGSVVTPFIQLCRVHLK